MQKISRYFRIWEKSNEKGFTLIELLVVISILGVLSAVAVPNVASLRNAANVSAANAEMATVQTAIQAAMTDHGVSSVTAGVISATSDITPAVNPYITGGVGTLRCSYTIDTDGQITTASSTLLGGITWDPTTHQFKKSP